MEDIGLVLDLVPDGLVDALRIADGRRKQVDDEQVNAGSQQFAGLFHERPKLSIALRRRDPVVGRLPPAFDARAMPAKSTARPSPRPAVEPGVA